jgi:hypothetical protein
MESDPLDIKQPPQENNINRMYRRNNNNPQGSRSFSHRANTTNVRPDAGRGSIMLGSRAQAIRRRRENRHHAGEQRDPQVARPLVDRITFDRRALGGQGHGQTRRPAQDAFHSGGRDQAVIQPQARPLIDRITWSNGASRGGVGAAHNLSTNMTAHGNVYGTNSISKEPSLFLTPQESQVAPEGAQETTFPFDPLFDEPVEAPAPQAPVRVGVPARTSRARTSEARTAFINNKAKSARVVKNPEDIFQNAKLRAVFAGKKIRTPKRSGGMLLRVGHAAQGIQGQELICTSPAGSNGDDKMG